MNPDDIASQQNAFLEALAFPAKLRAVEKAAWLEQNKPPANPPPNYLFENPDGVAEYLMHWFTWKYVESNQSCVPGANTTWRNYAAEAAREHAKNGLVYLQNLSADGDENALAAIADIAISATTTLTDLASHTPERVRPIASQRFFWPVLKARTERFGDDHRRLVKEIQLGDGTPFDRRAAARVRTGNLAVKAAMLLLCRLEPYRHKNPAVERLMFRDEPMPEWHWKALRLKPFSTETWRDWFEISWQLMLADLKGHPEHDPDLRKLGLYRAEHSTARYGGAQHVATAKTRDANIRDGIREKLRKAIKRLSEFPKRIKKK